MSTSSSADDDSSVSDVSVSQTSSNSEEQDDALAQAIAQRNELGEQEPLNIAEFQDAQEEVTQMFNDHWRNTSTGSNKRYRARKALLHRAAALHDMGVDVLVMMASNTRQAKLEVYGNGRVHHFIGQPGVLTALSNAFPHKRHKVVRFIDVDGEEVKERKKTSQQRKRKEQAPPEETPPPSPKAKPKRTISQ